MKKKMMKWKLGIALSLALFAGFAALGVRSSEAIGTDVFNAAPSLYVPYWRVDATTFSFLVIENANSVGSNPIVRFYDKDCKFIKDHHPTITTDDVEILDLNALLAPTTGEGGIIISTNGLGGAGGARLTAETIVGSTDGSTLRFHHINTAPSGDWTTFENSWSGAYFDASTVDNELFLFCPKKKTSGVNLMGDDLLLLADSPVGSATAFSTGVDILFFDEDENKLISFPLACSCVTRALLQTLTTQVVGTNGRIAIRSTTPGFDGEDFIAYMKRQLRGTHDLVDGYMFSN